MLSAAAHASWVLSLIAHLQSTSYCFLVDVGVFSFAQPGNQSAYCAWPSRNVHDKNSEYVPSETNGSWYDLLCPNLDKS